MKLASGNYHLKLSSEFKILRETKEYRFVLRAVADGGAASSTVGTFIHSTTRTENLPVGHTIVQGVDLFDGHLTVASQDVSLPGRGLSLDFSRTYSSVGFSDAGPLGAGWNHNYDVRLVRNGSGHFTVQGGEGSGNTFTNPHPDATLAQQWGLPANALFYDPQVGYHTTLVWLNPSNLDPSKHEYDFYTKSHVRYHFASDADECQLLQYIEEPNGNKVELYYDRDDPRAGSLPGGLKAAMDDDAMTLNVIKDSSGRALLVEVPGHCTCHADRGSDRLRSRWHEP